MEALPLHPMVMKNTTIAILFLVAGAMVAPGAAAETAAPVSRTLEFRREMMRKNAYLGEWRESHDGTDFTLSFATNEVGVLAFRCTVLPFRWKSDGKGKLRLFFEDALLLKETPALTYDPKTDTIDAAFGGVKCEDKFDGILKFRSLEYSSWVKPMLTEFTKPKPVPPPDYTINRAERYAKMVESNDPELKTITDWNEIMPLREILSQNVCWETVDLEYPRIRIRRGWLLSDSIEVIIAYRTKGKVPSAQDASLWKGWLFDEGNTLSLGPELRSAAAGLEELVEELEKMKVIYGLHTINYGEDNVAWKEGFLSCYIDEADQERIIRLMNDTVLKNCRMPRHYFVWKIKKTWEEEMKIFREEAKNMKETGKLPNRNLE